MIPKGEAIPTSAETQQVTQQVAEAQTGNTDVQADNTAAQTTDANTPASKAGTQTNGQAETQADTQSNGPSVPVDSQGKPLPLRTNSKGEQVVDEKTLWNNSPEEWCIYNDRNKDRVMSSDEMLDSAVKALDKQQKAVEKQMRKAQEAMDMDALDGLKEERKRLNDRKARLTAIQASRAEAAKIAEQEAQRVAEEAKKAEDAAKAAEASKTEEVNAAEEAANAEESKANEEVPTEAQIQGTESTEQTNSEETGAGQTANIDARVYELGEVSDTPTEQLPSDMAYRETDVNELKDIIEHGGMRMLPEGKEIEGAGRTFTTPDGKTLTLRKRRGNSEGGKGFAKGAPWSVIGGTLAGGKAQRIVIGVKGDKTQWQVGFHGRYSEPTDFSSIENSKPLLLRFDGNGEIAGLSVEDMQFWAQGKDGKYYEIKVGEKQGTQASQGTEAQTEQTTATARTDKQGNPLNEDGTLKVEEVKSIDELTDEDFTAPTRNVQLPKIPQNVDDAIGANGKPVVIKKNIFARNSQSHPEVTPQWAREILSSALYRPDLYGQNQKASRPYNWIVINTKDANGQNRLVVLEVNDNKDNIEIVHWYSVDARGVEKIKRQAQKEGGHILTLPSETEEAGALSGRQSGLSSADKVTESSGNSNTSEEKTEENAAPKNEGQFGLVSDARMEELKKRLKAKLTGQLNSGFDPEVLAIGMEMAAGYIDRGIKSFVDFSQKMIEEFGDIIRPYLKAFYNGAREMPGMEDLAKEMDSHDAVSAFDVNNFDRQTERIDKQGNPLNDDGKSEAEIKGLQKELKHFLPITRDMLVLESSIVEMKEMLANGKIPNKRVEAYKKEIERLDNTLSLYKKYASRNEADWTEAKRQHPDAIVLIDDGSGIYKAFKQDAETVSHAFRDETSPVFVFTKETEGELPYEYAALSEERLGKLQGKGMKLVVVQKQVLPEKPKSDNREVSGKEKPQEATTETKSTYERINWTSDSDISEMKKRRSYLDKVLTIGSAESKDVFPEEQQFRKDLNDLREKGKSLNEEEFKKEEEAFAQKYKERNERARAIYDELSNLNDSIADAEQKQDEKAREKEKVEKKSAIQTKYNGFLRGKSPMQAAAADKALSKRCQFDDEVLSLAEFVEKHFAAGDLKVEAKETQPYPSRSKWNRMTSAEQRTWMQSHKPTTSYFVNHYDLGKQAYDYAEYLKSQRLENIEAETQRKRDELFGLTPVEKISSAEEITSNIEKFVSGLVEHEGELKDIGFDGFVAGSEGRFERNAQKQVEEYVRSLSSVDKAITDEWKRQTGITSTDALNEYVSNLYRNAESARQKASAESQKGQTDRQGSNQSSEKQANTASGKIDDVGEKIAGARKDMLRDMAKSMQDVTEESLIALPFAKAFKRPDLNKAVEKGALRPKDARFAEAVMAALLSTSKPRLSKSRSSYDRKRSEYKIKNWAKNARIGVTTLEQLFSMDESQRDAFIEKAMNLTLYDEAAVDARIAQLKEWNGHNKNVESFGRCKPLNLIAVYHKAYEQLGYDTYGDVKCPVATVRPSSVYDCYELVDANGNRMSMRHPLEDEQAVVDEIVYATKVANGDMDTDHPNSSFSVIGTEPKYEVDGYNFFYQKGLNGRIQISAKFKTAEEAEAARQKMSERGYGVGSVSEAKTQNGYEKYVLAFNTPYAEPFELSEYTAGSKEELRSMLDAQHDEINDAVNSKLAEGKQKTRQIKDKAQVLGHWDTERKGMVYSVCLSDKYTPKDIFSNMPYTIKEGFATKKEAEAYLEEHRTEIEKLADDIDRTRREFTYFDGTNESRVGEDYRKGKDVSAEEFRSAFGFRGVQFGNWTNQKDRQAAINNAYDSFMDLAKLLGISPKALSLNGELGIAFGARGSGSAAAHYEPTEVVINLTKTQGAGSLAHEWWHALDNYFGRQGNVKLGFVTDNRGIRMRDEMRQAFDRLLDALEKSDYDSRSRQRGKSYWGSKVEETARMFEMWVSSEMAKRGESNNFLVGNGKGMEERFAEKNYANYMTAFFLGHKTDGKPMTFEEFCKTPYALAGFVYPTRAELETFGNDLRNIFDTVQERVDGETGDVALFQMDGSERDNTSPESRLAFDTVTEMLDNAGVETELLTNEEMEQLAEGASDDASLSRSKSPRAKWLDAYVNVVSRFLGRSRSEARAEMLQKIAQAKKEAKELYERVLSGNFDELTLQKINEYIDNATNRNRLFRPLSQRLPERALLSLSKGERTSCVDALFSRICESDVPANERTRAAGRRKIEARKEELLEAWAKATGNWHESIADFTNRTTAVDAGTDSDVYLSDDGTKVIKASKGKFDNRKFPTDIDQVPLFNSVFPGSAYRILGYGRLDGKFVRFLEQPVVDFSTATPLSTEERVAYMKELGFEAQNEEKTLFSNGEIAVSDLQKSNIVKDASGNIRVIDADVKIHTKDMGGEYTYPPVETDTDTAELMTDRNGSEESGSDAQGSGVEFLRNGDTVYGAAVGGKILLNAERLNPNTPVHEYTHLWDKAVQQKNPELWKRGVELMKQTSLWQQVANDPNYAGLDENGIASEVHSRLAGDKGEAELERMSREVLNGNGGVLDKAAKMSVIQKLRKWMSDFWYWVKNTLTPWSAEEAERVTLEDFVNMPLADLAKGTRLNETQLNAEDNDIRFHIVTDKKEIDRLNSEPTIKVYRAMQLIDGKLYPPMSAKVNGEWRNGIDVKDLGKVWEKSDESPELADAKGYFKLDKGNKSSLKARYNPYFHTSTTPLNDQFSSAQSRPELVTVEVEIPKSELTSGYKADNAKDSVGKVEWKAGVIQSQLTGTREVILSRWDKPVRIVPDSEVADVIVDMFGGRKITMPSNVVTPSLRAELEKRGVPFEETDNTGKPVRFREKKSSAEETDAAYNEAVEKGDKKEAQRLVDAQAEKMMPDSKVRNEDGTLKKVYHGSDTAGFTVFDRQQTDDGRSFFFTDNEEVGAAYAESKSALAGKGEDGNSYTVYLDLKNPFELDAEGSEWNGLVVNNVSWKLTDNVPEGCVDAFNRILAEMNKRGMQVNYANEETDVSYKFDYDTTPNLDEWFSEEEFDELTDELWEAGKSIEDIYDYIVPELNAEGKSTIGTNTRTVCEMAQDAGYDGVIFSNIKDGATRETQDVVANDYVAFDPSAIKSADAVTRDDEGKVIPLSERFNEGSEDIRFREFVDGVRNRDDFWEMTADALWGNYDKAEELMSALESYYGGKILSASYNAKKSMQDEDNCLLPFPDRMRVGLDGEYHHIKFEREDGETFVEAVPFDTIENVESKIENGELKTEMTLDESLTYRYRDNEISAVNSRFNEELAKQANGELEKGHIYQLGKPGAILRSTGVPNLPIELTSQKLAEKSEQRNHTFDILDVAGLPAALQSPMAVFSYGDKGKAQNIIVSLQRDGKQFVVGLHFNQEHNGLLVNSIRGLFNKDNAEWLNWISQGKALYINKGEIQALIDQQRTNLADVEYLDLDSIAKIVNDFENPKLDEETATQKEAGAEELAASSAKDRRPQSDSPVANHSVSIDGMREAGQQMSESLGVEVVFIKDSELPEGHHGAMGMWKGGKVYVCLENHESADEVKKTILHEVVGHKGLNHQIRKY